MLEVILEVLANCLVIQLSIVLFFAPFYILYRSQNNASVEKLSLSRHLEYFFLSKYANYLVFFWAMGEALVWFVIPEFLLLLVVFMRIDRKRELLLYDICGTTAGTLVGLLFHLPERLVSKLPYIQPNMLTQTRLWFDHSGVFALTHQPFSGVPYKVFLSVASEYHFFLPTFVIFAILVRVSRYYFAYAIFSTTYPLLHRFVYRNYVPLFLMATFIFSVLLLRVYGYFGTGYHLSLN